LELHFITETPRQARVLGSVFSCRGLIAFDSELVRVCFTTIFGLVYGLICTTGFNADLFGEEPVRVTVNKPVLPPPLPKTRGVFPGITFVALEEGLDRLARGAEPRSIRELQLLEDQQAKVSQKIIDVTVNVQQGSAQGSGVIITPDGYVLTAAHVAGKPGREATVILSDGRRVRARTLGTNRGMDAGLIQIIDLPSRRSVDDRSVAGGYVTKSAVVPASANSSPEVWPHATLGKSDDLRLGQWVIAAGHPGGWIPDRPAVVRAGRLLNIMRSTIVSDCALIGGDSGGPLFDLNGRLIGIHSRIGTETADNMHVPIDIYQDSWDRLADGQAWGTLPGYKPVIGVVGPERNGTTNTNPPAEIVKVVMGSPAAAAGLKEGDVIVRFDDTNIATFEELQRAVEGVAPGDRVSVEIERQGQRLRLRIIVGQDS
jgi:serine protease Do